MKRYEGLFILNNIAREDGIKETIDKITAEINATGGKVETVQKMDKRAFSRVANKRSNAGFFVNVIFESQPTSIAPLRAKFGLSEDVFRVVITAAPAVQAEAK